MPEGHAIHRIAKDHQRDFAGQRLKICSPQGRFATGAAQLTGRKLLGVEAYGKHLCYRWTREDVLHVHLGLYGKFRRHRLPVPEPRGQVRLRAVGREFAFDLNGPNQCQLMSRRQWRALTDRLGPDPLRNDADPQRAWDRIRQSRAAIGGLLLDQSVIAGVGNVYRSEVLFLKGIHPDQRGKDLRQDTFDEMWDTIVSLLKIGVRYNRIIISDPTEIGKPRSRMTRAERLLVYKRRFCARCDGPIASWELGARKVFACPQCQPVQ